MLARQHAHRCGISPVSRFFSHDPPTTGIYTLSLHDALPISTLDLSVLSEKLRLEPAHSWTAGQPRRPGRSEEHTSELQSRRDLVCRLLLEKKKSTQSEMSVKRLIVSKLSISTRSD